VQPWWERHPGRLESELAHLDHAGVAHTIDEDFRAHGVLRLAVALHVAGYGDVEGHVLFPDFYPYVRAEVYLPSLKLAHHQNPIVKNVCLISRDTRSWKTTDTVAWLLTSQLPAALAAGTAKTADADSAADLGEDAQAEPVSDYLIYSPAAMMLIDGAWAVPAGVISGDLTASYRGPVPPSAAPNEHTLGVVTEIRDTRGALLHEGLAPAILAGPAAVLRGRWSRTTQPLTDLSAEALWTVAEQADPQGGRSGLRGAPAQLRCLMFPEEVAWRQHGEGWLFLLRVPGKPGKPPSVSNPKKRRGHPGTPDQFWLIRTGRAGREDLAARAPELQGLDSKCVAIIGAGALGSSIADNLAKAGLGRLRLLDRDVLEPGNTIRHASFLNQSGLPKAVAAAMLAAARNPYVETYSTGIALGGVHEPGQLSDYEALDELLQGCHLVIDATAELGLQALLADESRSRGLPYLGVSATNGVWGGMTFLIPAGSDACYRCLQYHFDDGTIGLPPASPSGHVQPPGCASPTFTGAGFDLEQISTHAVRVAVAALLDGHAHGYPQCPENVAVLSLRDKRGAPMLPTWTGHTLYRHSACPSH
jgi:molybdopterin/thiamine biosynthesis adenylyltransferase